MEHHPLMRLTDETEITYSDLKCKDDGTEYFTVYFETPSEKYGFCSMNIDFPNGTPNNIIGYSENDIQKLLYHFFKVAPVIYNDLKEIRGKHMEREESIVTVNNPINVCETD